MTEEVKFNDLFVMILLLNLWFYVNGLRDKDINYIYRERERKREREKERERDQRILWKINNLALHTKHDT